MKIIVEHYNEKVSIETQHDDLTFEDFMELIRKVAHGAGYANKTIDEWFDRDL